MYNAEKFISKCLTHLMHQTYKKLELIIVDDGSTDKCVDICKEYAKSDNRIKIITQQNSGPSVAMNTGFDASHGQYIHFHDHDDWVNLDYFEKMINAAIITDADIMCSEVNQPQYNFPKFTSIEICTELSDKIRKTRANRLNPAWRYMYKKSFLEQNNLRYEPAIFGDQDVYFTKPAIILAASIATVPGAIYNVVDTDTALGKSRGKINERNNTPAAVAASNKYQKFLFKNNATKLMSQDEWPVHTNTFKMFNITIAKKDIFYNKIRYYLFGINIGTTYLDW